MPYDELGNYVPGDEAPSVDEMRYELAKRQKEQSVSDLLDKYISDPIRGVSTAGAEVIKRLPGADLAQAAMNIGTGLFAPAAAVPASIYKGVKSGEYGKSTNVAGKEFEDLMREFTYEPRTQGGRDIMEGIAKAIEVSKLPPYLGHIYTPRAPLSANDVRVLAKRGIETGREIAAIPEDFLMAQQGLKRESNLGGTTYGAKLQSVAEDIGDVAARRAARKADEGYVPKPGSVEVFGNLVPETNLYAVKPTGGQLVKAIDPITGQLREIPDSSVAGISDVYENIRKQTEGQGLINQYMRTFVNRPGIQDIWEDFNAKKVFEEFPKAPTPDQAREAFQVKYPTSKARNERMVAFFDEFAQSPEAQAAAANLGIKIPTFEDYQKRIEAANTWAQKGLTNYVQKFIGTKEDPALQLATQGVTFKSPERLLENASDAMNYASPTALKAERKAAGFNEEGEVQPFLKEKLVELKAVDEQLREMVTRRNALYEMARQQNVDPASNPEYAELTNKLASKTAEKERITQQAENYKLGKAYETISDLAIEKRSPKDLSRKLTFAEKQLVPWLEKTPEDATLYDVDPRLLERLGLTDMASMFMDDIVSGKIPIEQIGNISIPKYIQESAAARMAKEAAAKKDLAAKQKVFDNYLQEQVQQIPSDKMFGNAGVLEITNAMDEDTIRRHLSTDTEILDHCVGQGGQGREGKQYIPMVDPATGETPKGSSGENTSYVRNILKKGDKIVSFRDLVTGKPVGTLELSKQPGDRYNIGYASGYRNGRMQSMYSESLANYLNSIDDDINGSGDNLTKNGVIDRLHTNKHDIRDITGLSDNELKQLSFEGLPRFLTRDAIVNLNNERKSMLPSAQLNNEAATLNTSYSELLDENQRLNFDLQNADDDLVREELMNRRSEIANQLADIGQRIGNMPLEDLTTVARELINDVFPPSMTTARSRLQHLDNESPVSMRIQPRLFETMRDVLRDQRDAVGAPLSTTQQFVVNDEWQRISREIVPTINGNMYNGRAVANNIRRNPDRYGLGDYQDQVIDGIARQVEERGLQDPRNAPLGYVIQFQTTLPRQTVERLNNLFGNLPRGTTNEAFEQAIYDLQQYQQAYQNPPEQSLIRDLTEPQRLEAIGEIQRRIEDLQRRMQLRPLVNSARPAEQRQDLAVVVDRLYDAVVEDYGQPVADYVRDALETINYNVNEDAPLYIERVRRLADEENYTPAQNAFNMIADRLVQGERANIAAARNEAAQLPAIRDALPTPRDIANDVLPQGMAQRDYASNALTEAINNEIRALPTTDEELHAYVNAINSRPLDLPDAIELHLVNDEQRGRISDYLIQQASARIDTLQRQAERQVAQAQEHPVLHYRRLDPAFIEYVTNEANQARTADDVMALERRFLPVDNPMGYGNDQRQAIQEILNDRRWTLANGPAQEALPTRADQMSQAVGNIAQNIINENPDRNQIQRVIDDLERGAYPIRQFEHLTEEARNDAEMELLMQLHTYHDSIPAPEPRMRDPRVRYGTDVMAAQQGIMADNNQFRTPDEMQALRALPQLIRRPGATRMSLGLGAFSNEQANQLARIFEALYEVRMAEFAGNENNRLTPPAPEGHKHGGYIQSYSDGGEAISDYPEIDAALNQPGLKHKFTAQNILSNYGDSVIESYDKAKARKRLEPIVLKQATQPELTYDDGQSLMRRNLSAPLGNASPIHAPSGQSFEDLQRQHMDKLRPHETLARGYTGVKSGGYIQSSKNRLLSPNTDEMRLALLKGK